MRQRSNARSVRPTDLVALVSYDGQVYPNEALSWERLARGEGSPHPLENALEQWFSFATGRYTWISVKGQSIRGMLSARRRGGGLAWEVDCLILTEADPDLIGSLVERMTEDASRAGTRRIYLRLRDDAPSQALARATGFVPSRREALWVAEGGDSPATADPPIRPREKEDALALFSLYNAAVPPAVRGLEATTLQEWVAFMETRSFGTKAQEWVLEEEGVLTGAIRLARRRSAGWLELTSRPENRWLDALFAAGLRRLGGKRSVYALAPEHSVGIEALLAAGRFNEVATAVTLVKRIAVPIAELETAPAVHPVVAV